MPTAAQNLPVDASKQQVQEAISKCISQLVGEGRKQDQAVAICHEQARRATGHGSHRAE